jgi:alpha-galactosidase
LHSWSVNPQRKDDRGKTDGSSQEPLSPGIHSDETRLVWALVTEHSAYAIGATATGHVVNLHWGARLVTLDDLPDAFLPFTRSSQDPSLTSALEEYPGFGGCAMAKR